MDPEERSSSPSLLIEVCKCRFHVNLYYDNEYVGTIFSQWGFLTAAAKIWEDNRIEAEGFPMIDDLVGSLDLPILSEDGLDWTNEPVAACGFVYFPNGRGGNA
ncbi:MAG: hypothetical protein CEN90_154 [Parcubacteria group bacterium Licking1014_17]|nr:MAG: hypothetical protein CEN90_154 [Parcubacteria group bacterium Licking1014_17]